MRNRVGHVALSIQLTERSSREQTSESGTNAMYRMLTYSKSVVGVRLPNVSSMCSLNGMDMAVMVHVSHLDCAHLCQFTYCPSSSLLFCSHLLRFIEEPLFLLGNVMVSGRISLLSTRANSRLPRTSKMSVRLSDFVSVTTEYNGEAGWLLNIFVFFISSRLKLYDLGGVGFVGVVVVCMVQDERW